MIKAGSITVNGISLKSSYPFSPIKSVNIDKSFSLVFFTKNSFKVFEPFDNADLAGKFPSRYGSSAVLFISVRVGVIIKKVRKSAIAIRTWFGGVCWVPIACLRMERTIIILVKELAPSTIDGSKVSPVIRASI